MRGVTIALHGINKVAFELFKDFYRKFTALVDDDKPSKPTVTSRLPNHAFIAFYYITTPSYDNQS